MTRDFAFDDMVITQQEVMRLKKRRDELLTTACTRFEWVDMLGEVKAINRRLLILHRRIGEQPSLS